MIHFRKSYILSLNFPHRKFQLPSVFIQQSQENTTPDFHKYPSVFNDAKKSGTEKQTHQEAGGCMTSNQTCDKRVQLLDIS